MGTQQRDKNNMGGSGMADATKDAAGRAGDAVKDAASSVVHKAQDAASSMGHKAQDVASSVGHKAQDAASSVAHKAQDAGAYIAHKAEDATSAVGGEMKSLAGAIRTKGPHDGMLGNASSAVANTLENYGRELEEHGLSGIADDITSTVRRHPIPAVLIGVGLGFLLARVFTK